MRTIDFYHSHFDKQPTYDLTRISWTDETKSLLQKRRCTPFDDRCIRNAMYRPFCKQQLYFNHDWNTRPYQMPRLFPTPQSKNLVICVSGANIRRPFSCLITDVIPDLHIFDEGTQCFPLYWYEKNECDQLSLFDSGKDEYKRHSGLSNFIVQRAREEYGPKVTAEDVFYYVYGFLHSQEYRQRFANNLKKGLARIHLAATT